MNKPLTVVGAYSVISDVLPGRVAFRRMKMRMTRRELADMVGCHPSAITHIESGRNLPNVCLLAALSDALDTTPDYLMGFDEMKSNRKEPI